VVGKTAALSQALPPLQYMKTVKRSLLSRQTRAMRVSNWHLRAVKWLL